MAVNVNYQEAQTGYSALHYAVQQGNTKLVNLLVKNYADIKAQDAKKQNPLHFACIAGNLEVFRILLGACYGAIEGVDQHKKTPVDYAKQNNHKELVDFLRSQTSMLYSIEKFTLQATLEEEKRRPTGRSRHASRPVTLRNFNVKTKDFKRIGVLGQGAYAEVYIVERLGPNGQRTGLFYAMKRMKKRTYNGLTRFVITEKEIQRKIDHRFVTKLHYAFQTFEYLYMLTDYCPGGDMRSVIN